MKNRVQRQGFLVMSPRAAKEKEERINRKRAEDPGRRLYATREWKVLRALQLREYPQCQCGQRATVVDHVKRHEGDASLFFDRANHRSMCKSCHDKKTVMIDGGFGRDKQTVQVPDATDGEQEYFIV